MIVIAQPLDYPRCKTKNCWRSVDVHSLGMATSVWLVLLTRKTSNTFPLFGCEHLAIWLQIVKDYESLTLPWRSHYRKPNCQCKLNHCSPNVYWNYWQPIILFYILFFASWCFVAPHYLIHYFLCDVSDKWRSHIAFQRFRPAISCMETRPLIFD